jgi:hypothetical protein
LPITVAALMLIAVQYAGSTPRFLSRPVSGELFAPSHQSLAEQYGGWRRVGHRIEQRNTDSIWGEHSAVWDFSSKETLASVSLDYPFEGWHELTNCYRNTGWQIDFREVRRIEGESDEWPLVVVFMQRDLGQHAVLCYSIFDRDGNPVLPARDQLTSGVADRWKRATGQLGTYQVQTFRPALAPPSEQELKEQIALHCEVWRDLIRAVSRSED